MSLVHQQKTEHFLKKYNFFCTVASPDLKPKRTKKEQKPTAQKSTANKPIIKAGKKIKQTKNISIPYPELSSKDMDYQKFLGN